MFGTKCSCCAEQLWKVHFKSEFLMCNIRMFVWCQNMISRDCVLNYKISKVTGWQDTVYNFIYFKSVDKKGNLNTCHFSVQRWSYYPSRLLNMYLFFFALKLLKFQVPTSIVYQPSPIVEKCLQSLPAQTMTSDPCEQGGKFEIGTYSTKTFMEMMMCVCVFVCC